jgi:hypothetical protein
LGGSASVQVIAQGDDTGPGIQDERFASRSYFNTGGIPSVFDRPRAGHRVAAPHSPEFDPQFFRHGLTSILSYTFIIQISRFLHKEIFPREGEKFW